MSGFPLEVHLFEANKAETKTLVPVLTGFAGRHQIADVVVVSDAGMLSAANLLALEDAGYGFIAGSKTTSAAARERLHRRAGRRDDPHDGSGKDSRERRVVYEYSVKQSQHDNRAINKMIERAEAVAGGTRPLKKHRFVKITNAAMASTGPWSTVITQTTASEALYVGMTRGRQANTAHVVTRATPVDAPPGTVFEAVHRSPAAVLAGVFETSDPQRSALSQAVDSATEAESVRTPSDLFADAAQIATAGRTANWLDELVNGGHLTPDQRIALAVEDGATTLTGLLRRVELAGHDPQQTLTEAVTRRSLDDARQITSVLHARISDRIGLDPVGDTFADWTPAVDDPQWQTYLATLAQAADERRNQLGRAAAAEPPAWAVEAFGPLPPPDRLLERAGWEKRAAAVAAYRELAGHDDQTDALGPPPKSGQVEAYAAWRSAWRALGRPEADRAEAEMSTGQLRIRIRAYDREKAWAPDYVANQLAGTRQAADKHRHDAALWEGQAAATADQETAVRLHDDATKSAALAQALDDRASQLMQADEARAAWYAHTAETRAAAERAAATISPKQSTSAPATNATPVQWTLRRGQQNRLLRTFERWSPGRQAPRGQPATATGTPYAFPPPTRPRPPYAGRSVRCRNLSTAKPPTPVMPKTRPATKPHVGMLSNRGGRTSTICVLAEPSGRTV